MGLPKKKELKSCPFCTGENSITIVHFSETDLPYWGECCLCKARGPARETRQAAVDEWNTRPFEDKFRQHDDDGMYLDGHEDGYAAGRDEENKAWREDVAALRERIDELEWLREVEEVSTTMWLWHPYFMTNAEKPDVETLDNAEAEHGAIIKAARAAVEA